MKTDPTVTENPRITDGLVILHTCNLLIIKEGGHQKTKEELHIAI